MKKGEANSKTQDTRIELTVAQQPVFEEHFDPKAESFGSMFSRIA